MRTRRDFIKAGALWVPAALSGRALGQTATAVTGNAQQALVGQLSPPPSAPSCTTIHAENSSAESGSYGPDTPVWCGQLGYDPGANISVCAMEWSLTLANGVSYQASIWLYNGSNVLTTQQGSYSDPVVGTGSQAWSKFSFGTPIAISNGTNYALAVSRVDGAASQFRQFYSNAGGFGGIIGRWAADKSLAYYDTVDSLVKVYKS